MVWNKIELTFDEIRFLRRLFFRKKLANEIKEKTGLTPRIYNRIAMENNWNKKRERYLSFICRLAYRNGISILELSDKVDIKVSILYNIKRKYNFKTERFNPHNKRMSDVIEREIIDKYENFSSTKIAKQFKFKTSKSILDILKKHNIKTKKPNDYTDYNESYFEKIDSHDKSYILGLLLADGYVINKKSGFGIQLSKIDVDILNKIKQRIGNSCSIVNIKGRGLRKICGRFAYSKDMKRLSCHNQKIAFDLSKFNIVKNKTSRLTLPKINKKYYSSFFRGFIDGDGSVGINKNTNYPWCQFVCCNNIFLEECKYLLCRLGFNVGISYGKSISYLYIKGGRESIFKFLRWLYKNKGDMYLERKYEKVQNYIN